jgi:hypothetical protein
MGKKKPQGYYCKICGQRKSNESFSGKGHANHICKSCSRKSPAEQAADLTMNKLCNMPMRRLTDNEKKWLENRAHDSREEVRALAKEVYNQLFPYTERNKIKKELYINKLTLLINTTVWDEFGGEEMVHCRFEVYKKSHSIKKQDFSVNTAEPKIVLIPIGEMNKLLKWAVHSLEIFCWEQDYCSNENEASDNENFYDEDDFEEFIHSAGLPFEEPNEEAGTLIWQTVIEYSNSMAQDTKSYDTDLPDRVEELYWELQGYFDLVNSDNFDEE